MCNNKSHPAVVLQMHFGFCPPRQRRWIITWREIRHSFSSFNTCPWICLGKLVMELSGSLNFVSPLLPGQLQVPHSEDSSLLFNFLVCLRHLEETMIWQFLGGNILLFKSYYSRVIIAAGGNIPGETNQSSWHHQADFPKGGRGIPHPFCPAAFQRLQH